MSLISGSVLSVASHRNGGTSTGVVWEADAMRCEGIGSGAQGGRGNVSCCGMNLGDVWRPARNKIPDARV
jgi:hypothetical protein